MHITYLEQYVTFAKMQSITSLKNYFSADTIKALEKPPTDLGAFMFYTLPNPEVLEKHFRTFLEIRNFYIEIQKELSFTGKIHGHEYPSLDEYEKALSTQKKQLKEYLAQNKIVWGITKYQELLSKMIIDIVENSDKTDYSAWTGALKQGPIKKWKKSLLEYYTKESQTNHNILTLPYSFYTVPGKTAPQITEISSETQAALTIAKPQKPRIDTPSLNIKFSEEITNGYTTLNDKREIISLVYDKLTPEEQHTVESIFDTHVPQVVNNLETLIKIQSPKVDEVTDWCNTILTQSTQKLEAIIQRVEDSTYNSSIVNKNSIHQILNA